MNSTHWNDTIKTALLGTNRAELPTFPTNSAREQLLTQFSQEDDAATLLAIAGTIALHSQTGWQPSQSAPTAPAHQLPESQPILSTPIASQLERC